ncbi:histidine kinase [Flavobacterium sp.]|uniref:sensor histidine kinase n=1 Tax=Flavobacterium sp. TaxID=239 RepID=UPI0025C1BB1E|nr:histidine kinase [Flavobacterium sp.]MBA4153721.1 hypothetical protein [Flavobacterium sp.]MDP2160376.1 histidine kinase [Flavobacterium sp.]
MENEAGLKLIFWISTLAMLLLILALFSFALIYRKNTYKLKQKESENLLIASLESEKRERQRIAADFHDSVSGDLNAIRNYITILDRSEDSPFNKTILMEIKSALDNTLSNIQHISYNLMPPLLETLGFVPTLNDYFERIKKLNNITIAFQYYQKDLPVSPSDAYELFRIIQELISNMLKHGNINYIHFSIEKNKEIIEIKITDDGIPFNFYQSLRNTSGMGLKNIISRAKHIGTSVTQIPSEKGNIIIIQLNK